MSALDPARWDAVPPGALAVGPKAAGYGRRFVLSAQHPLSALAGLGALREGGTAADALVAAAAVDTVVQPGTSSLGGSLAVVYHEATSGQTHALNAGLNRPLRDTGPYDHLAERATGRAVLVPGLVAGLEHLWRRFGTLPWSELWRPARHFAQEGFLVYEGYAAALRRRAPVLLRHAEGRAIFAPDGALPEVGATFRQPALAETLGHVAAAGANYLYRGSWAEAVVAATRELGGKLGVEDLARYAVRWGPPAVGAYLGYELRTTAAPHYGGPLLLLALGIAEALDLHRRPPRAAAARTLYDEIQVYKAVTATTGLAIDPQVAAPEALAAFRRLLSPDHARRVAARIRRGGPLRPTGLPGSHSHHVAGIDEAGNMVTATHTIESDGWGDTGLFVGGVALNSTAYALQGRRSPPGERIAEPLSAYLVVRDGAPVLAAGAISAGLLGANLQNTVNVLAHGQSLGESIAAPRWGCYDFDLDAWREREAVQVEAFAPTLLDAVEALGQPLARVGWADTGYWAAAGYDSGGGRTAVTDPRLWGRAVGE